MLNIPSEIPGEKLLMKILDIVEKAGGIAAEPWRVRRLEGARTDAEVDRRLRLAATDQQIEAMQRGEITLEEILNSPEKPSNLLRREPHLLPVPRNTKELFAVADTAASLQNARRYANLLQTVEVAQEDARLTSDEAVSDATIELDWFDRWREGAERASTEDARRLWAKILCKEATNPGKFSFHTLSLLSRLSKRDAESISRLSAFVICRQTQPFIINLPYQLIETPKEDATPRPYDLNCAEDLGLIRGIDSIELPRGYHVIENYIPIILMIKDGILIAKPVSDEKFLTIPLITVTSLGKEIFSTIDAEPTTAYILAIADHICRRGFSVFYRTPPYEGQSDPP